MTFSIEGDCQIVLTRLFQTDGKGHLRFGWNAISQSPATIDDLIVTGVWFHDFIMEGFVDYRVSAKDLIPGCSIAVLGSGSNRDCYIPSSIRFCIEQAGLKIASESTVV